MFTGLIQALGTIRPLGNDHFQLSCQGEAAQMLLSLEIGDSVAVDGVCLTVEEIVPQGFVATASPETLRRTTLGQLQRSAGYVNLETSLRVGSKLGGHFVTGHVDGIGCLQEAVQTENSWEMTFTAPPFSAERWQLGRYIIPKGSIAVNGVSLTVAECDSAGSWFKVAVIPHTYAETNLCYLQTGSLVNLEGDILGKYVEKFLSAKTSSPVLMVEMTANPLDEISPAFLSEHGYS